MLLNAECSFRRLKGHRQMPLLVAALARHIEAATPGDDCYVIVNPLIELDPDDPDRAHAELTWLYVVKGPRRRPEASQTRPLQRHLDP